MEREKDVPSDDSSANMINSDHCSEINQNSQHKFLVLKESDVVMHLNDGIKLRVERTKEEVEIEDLDYINDKEVDDILSIKSTINANDKSCVEEILNTECMVILIY